MAKLVEQVTIITSSKGQPAMKKTLHTKSLSILSALTAGVIALGCATTVYAAPQIDEIDRSKPVDLNKYPGGERPDDQEVLEAFSAQMDRLADCVEGAKDRAKMGEDDRMEGGALMTILLNPEGERPLAVSAELPEKVKKDKRLRQCLRVATWKADYPSYDGPPIEVDFEFELDPGYDWVEE